MATNTADNVTKNEVGQAFIERYAGRYYWGIARVGSTASARDAEEFVLSTCDGAVPEKSRGDVERLQAIRYRFTGRVRQAAEGIAKKQQRPVIYLASSRVSKEDEARQIQRRDGVKRGLIAILSCVEPCRRWSMRGNRASKKLELSLEWGKCTHLY
jgi:hypothetical protein